MILVGLGVALYFIIDDAIDKKIEACLTKHFYTEKVFEKLDITPPKDPLKITYSKEECQSIVDQARNRTVTGIQGMTNTTDCVKEIFVTQFVDFVLLKSALEKKNKREDGSKILLGILPKAKALCKEV